MVFVPFSNQTKALRCAAAGREPLVPLPILRPSSPEYSISYRCSLRFDRCTDPTASNNPLHPSIVILDLTTLHALFHSDVPPPRRTGSPFQEHLLCVTNLSSLADFHADLAAEFQTHSPRRITGCPSLR